MLFADPNLNGRVRVRVPHPVAGPGRPSSTAVHQINRVTYGSEPDLHFVRCSGLSTGRRKVSVWLGGEPLLDRAHAVTPFNPFAGAISRNGRHTIGVYDHHVHVSANLMVLAILVRLTFC